MSDTRPAYPADSCEGLRQLAASLATISTELRAIAGGNSPEHLSYAFRDFLDLIQPGERYAFLPRALRCTTCGEYSLTAPLDKRGHCPACALTEALWQEHARELAEEQRYEEMAEAAAPRCPDCNGPTRWVDDEDGGYPECAAERDEGCPARRMADPLAEGDDSNA